MAKITLKHPDTGEVRHVSNAAAAVTLQAHHGYQVEQKTEKAKTPADVAGKQAPKS